MPMVTTTTIRIFVKESLGAVVHNRQRQQQQQQIAVVISSSSSSSSSSLFSTLVSSLPKEQEQKQEQKKNAKKNVDHDEVLVEGVWIFCRHGDRTPGRILSPAHFRQEESCFWTSRLPFPNSMHAFTAFCKHFPPLIHDPGTNQGQFLDAKRNPFGFLTQKGIVQLKTNGQFFFDRYSNNNTDSKIHHSQVQVRQHETFLQKWDVQVYSTNYLRTILSAQSFLDGLLGTQCYDTTTNNKERERTFDLSVDKEELVPDHCFVREQFWTRRGVATKAARTTSATTGAAATNDGTRQGQSVVPIQIRKLSQDPLNAFDRNPDAMADFVGMVIKNQDFQARDLAAAPLAAQLSNIIPGLVRPHRSDFSSRAPSGINWVEAADHFVCRESHGIPYARYSDWQDDERVEQTLKAMARQTKAHLSWRFRQWYHNRFLLASIAAPPLRDVVKQMEQQIQVQTQPKRPFTLYSCHDITLLGLLYGMGADFLVDETSIGWDFWPPYASALVLELIRTNNNNKQGGGGGDDKRADFAIRILLVTEAGRSVRTIPCLHFGESIRLQFANPNNFPTAATCKDNDSNDDDDGNDGNGSKTTTKMMTIQELNQLVTAHESEGGDCARLQ